MESAVEISELDLRDIEESIVVLLALANSMEGGEGVRPSGYAERLRAKAERMKAITQRHPSASWEASERFLGVVVSEHEQEIFKRLRTFES